MKKIRIIGAVLSGSAILGVGGCDPTAQVALLQDQLCTIADAVGDEFDINVPDFCD